MFENNSMYEIGENLIRNESEMFSLYENINFKIRDGI